VRIETSLAKVSKSRVERRDPSGMYNRVDRGVLATLAPTIAWDGYFAALGAPEARALSVTAPKFFEGLDALVRREKAEALRDYLVWHVLHRTAPNLGAALEAEAFALTQLLTGQKVERARFKRCVDATDEALGDLLAQPFVERRFAGESKLAAESYVRAIAAEMRTKLDGLAWMDAATRDKARAKLDAMAYLIGYPAKWKSYDFPLGEAHAANVLAGAAFRVRDNLAKIGKSVDRGEWFMTPPTVNAYYDPQKNQMVFPAGILQPPFYSASASVPVNLGAMGMVVGHELTHGFDDEGSQFDAVGNLASWWSPDTRGTFESRAACVEQQYAAYEVLPGIKLNGNLTLGENIADAGGVELAFRAYRALRREAPTRVVADGLDEDQQFFVAAGQIWCAEYRDEAARLMAATDPHSHPRHRVNGPLSHLPAFAEAFACKAGSPMVAAPRCEVW
jgi:putative endopeptidase